MIEHIIDNNTHHIVKADGILPGLNKTQGGLDLLLKLSKIRISDAIKCDELDESRDQLLMYRDLDRRRERWHDDVTLGNKIIPLTIVWFS